MQRFYWKFLLIFDYYTLTLFVDTSQQIFVFKLKENYFDFRNNNISSFFYFMRFSNLTFSFIRLSSPTAPTQKIIKNGTYIRID